MQELVTLECTEAKKEGKPVSRYLTYRNKKTVTERIEKTQLEIKSLLSKKEDVNMAEAIVNLRRQETVYQSVLEVGHRAISAMSLFDMLS